MALSEETSTQVLNTQYAVFFGVIFGLSFYVKNETPPELGLSIAPQRIPLILTLLIYYITDWFSANAVRNRIKIRTWELYIQVFSVVLLGIVIVCMNTAGMMKYIMLGAYGSLVSTYDVLLQWRITNRTTSMISNEDALPHRHISAFGMNLAGMRLVFSFVIFAVASISIARVDVSSIFEKVVFSLIAIFVFLKIIRLIHLSYLGGNNK